MHSLLFLLFGMAAHAFDYTGGPSRSSPAPPRRHSRTFIHRDNQPFGMNPSFRYQISGPTDNMTPFQICPTGAPEQDGVFKAPINTGDLSGAQQLLMEWCDKGNVVGPSTGNQGQVMTSGGATVQFCNQQDTIETCNSDEIKKMFDVIQCGSQQFPTLGSAIGMNFYVSYAPTNDLGPCLSISGVQGEIPE